MGKPKDKTTAYAFFVQEQKDEFQKANPEKKIVFGDFMKKCGAKWHKLEPKDKVPFEKQAANISGKTLSTFIKPQIILKIVYKDSFNFFILKFCEKSGSYLVCSSAKLSKGLKLKNFYSSDFGYGPKTYLSSSVQLQHRL